MSSSYKIASSGIPYQTSLDFTHFPLGDGTELIYCPLTRDVQRLSAGDAEILQRCTLSSTLSDHAQTIAGALRLDRADTLRRLEHLAHLNLLVATSTIMRSMSEAEAQTTVSQIRSLGIPTRDNPENLRRCLLSFAECARQYNRRLDYLVADSSPAPSMRASNIEVLKGLKESDIELRYYGLEERKGLVSQLSKRAGIEPSVLEFAIENPQDYPIDTGGNRNLLLLCTAGELTLQIDDDVLCRVMPAPNQSDVLVLSSQYNPTSFLFLDEIEQLDQHFVPQDFYGLHEQMLGQSIGSILRKSGETSCHFDQVRSPFVIAVQSGAGVAVTALGVAGDSGMASSTYFLKLEGDSRDSLLRSQAVWANALLNHRVVRAAGSPQISDDAYCMGINLGLDNRRSLPPFMPVQRNEDSIFSALLRATGGEGLLGYLPWAVSHGVGLRRRRPVVECLERQGSGEIIHAVLRAFNPISGAGAERNTASLARLLIDWGAAPLGDFEEFIRTLLSRQAGHQIALIENLLHKYDGKPDYWSAEAKAYAEGLSIAAASKNYVVARDLEDAFGESDARLRLQKLVAQLGELLQAWPALRRAAEELKEEDKLPCLRI